MYLLGYIPKDDRLYLGDKELNIVSYSLLVSVLEYQTAVMRRDFGMADKVLPTIPKEQRTRVAHFLEKQVSQHENLIFFSLELQSVASLFSHHLKCYNAIAFSLYLLIL